MVNRRILMQSAGALLAQALVSNAQTSTPPRGPIFQHDLPNVNMNNWAVTVVEVNYAPGQSSNAHRHPGITIVYVLEARLFQRSETGLKRPTRWDRCSWRRQTSCTVFRVTQARPSLRSFWLYCWRKKASSLPRPLSFFVRL